MKLDIATETGYKAALSVVGTPSGEWEVKASTVFRGLNLPAIVIKKYGGTDAKKKAEQYAVTLKAALLGVSPLEVEG